MADDMDVDIPATGSGKNTKDDGKEKKRFEVKKHFGRGTSWSTIVPSAATISWISALIVKQIKYQRQQTNATLLGAFAIMPSTSTASHGGSRQERLSIGYREWELQKYGR
ncbi:RING/U-box [Chiua virens]|nr:RING/U-box [Chiua virens]